MWSHIVRVSRICSSGLAGFAAVCWRPDEGTRLHRRQRVLHLGFIETVCVGKHIRRGNRQEIGAQNDLWHRGVEDGQQMGTIDCSHFIVPPALRHIGHLAWCNGKMQQLVRKRIDQRDDCSPGDTIDEFSGILVVMRFHHV
ncbi:hypothetical protein D3C73_1069520 [compost metagenome]